jgi:hypothetical protein
MNNLFDALNSSNLCARNPMNRPLSENSDSYEFLKKFNKLHRLSTSNTRLVCLDGLKQTINGNMKFPFRFFFPLI